MAQRNEITFKQKLKYKFDNIMAAGTIAIIGWLFVLSLLLIVISGIVVSIGAFQQDPNQTMGFS